MIQVTPSDIVQEKILKCLNDSFAIRVKSLDEAIKLANAALSICRPDEDTELIAFAKIYLAYYLMVQSHHEESLDHLGQAKKLLETTSSKQASGMVEYITGTLSMKTDDYHLALRHFLIAIELFSECSDYEAEARTSKMMGQIYELFGDYEKAIEAYQKAIKIGKAINDKDGISNASNTLSGIYLKKGQVKEAEILAKKSIQLKESSGDYRGLGFSNYALGKVALTKDNLTTAEKLFRISLEIHEKTGDMIGCMMALNKLGRLALLQHDHQSAKDYFHRCISFGDKSNHHLITQKAYYSLFDIAKKEKKFEEAIKYIELHEEFKNMVIDRDAKNLMHSIQTVAKMEILEKEASWQKENNAKIERKNKELDSFVYKVTHDLRGPISSLMGLTQLVKMEIEDEKSLEYFNIYDNQIQRINNILMDFMNLIQIKEKELAYEQINFKQLVDECINSFSFHEHFCKIDFNVQIDDKLIYISDRSTVTSIVQNLIENAIKYARIEKSPYINVSVESCDEKVCIEVEDNGLGIKKSDQEKIFDMFYRAHNNAKGTGLGLYILKSAVEKLNGELSLKSKVNSGSTFTINLPLENQTKDNQS